MVNTEEIKLVVKDLEADLSRWDQGVWVSNVDYGETPVALELPGEVSGTRSGKVSVVDPNVCGTRFCIAGMAVHRAGYLLGADRNDNETVYTRDGVKVGNVATVACQILGLTPDQGEVLFESDAGIVYDANGWEDKYDFNLMKELITEFTGVTFDD